MVLGTGLVVGRIGSMSCGNGILCVWAVLLFGSSSPEAWAVDFNRDVRPILSEHCFKCHGPDGGARQAGLRLDTFEGATGDRTKGPAVVVGDPKASRLLVMVEHDDPTVRMPPVETGEQLSADQIEILRRWITDGAKYSKHWSFVSPVRWAPLNLADDDWSRNAVDRFVLARLRAEEIKPSPQADRRTLIRRLSFDLNGQPPTLWQIEAFLADWRPDAYQRLVRRLLDSPNFGERMSLDWLDAARYADTHGFNNDSKRTMWRWRDWVIDAFNTNLPYDRFIVEQLAGDLLANPTVEQHIATGFNRNHVVNSEGGIIDEEYRVEYVADRVHTTATVFMGLTMECARCHDHKYDPISQKDYYRFFAFFNNVPEKGEDGRIANAAPIISAPTRSQQARLSDLKNTRAVHHKAMSRSRGQLQGAGSGEPWVDQVGKLSQRKGPVHPEAPAIHLGFDRLKDGKLIDQARLDHEVKAKPQALLADGIDGLGIQLDGRRHLNLGALALTRGEKFSIGLWVHPDQRQSVSLVSKINDHVVKASTQYRRGIELRLDNERIEVRFSHTWPAYSINVKGEPVVEPRRWQHLMITYDGSGKAHGVRIYHDGRELDTQIIHDGLHAGGFNEGSPLLLCKGGPDAEPGFRGRIDDFRIYRQALNKDQISGFVEPLLLAEAIRINRLDYLAHHHLLANDEDYKGDFQAYTQAQQQLLELQHHLPSTMVMSEMPRMRQAYVLERGYYAARGETVEPAALEQLLVPFPNGAPRNRLGLGRWLARPDHPLTARVAVNRIWQQLFGTGLVKTAENFGLQGEWPSHRELLDFLAVELAESGWNLKQLIEQIVSSATYRQSSAIPPDLLKHDPENRLLGRGPRFRLPAELIRDQALAVSGLLEARIGGESVYPYQPDGLYRDVVVGANYPGTRWLTSKGADLYRRSIYTFWKRTLPYPGLVSFDAPEREFCMVRRSRTNTPLQALVLLNDPTYLEAARKLAERVMVSETDPQARLARAFELATARLPTKAELSILQDQLKRRLTHYGAHQEQAAALLKAGDSDREASLDAGELAAYTTVASMILNLDETVTKG